MLFALNMKPKEDNGLSAMTQEMVVVKWTPELARRSKKTDMDIDKPCSYRLTFYIY